MTVEKPCPLCGSAAPKRALESHRDAGNGVLYRMLACGACGVAFADPFEHPGVDWYQHHSPGSDTSRMSVWRFSQALDAPLPAGARVLDVGCGPGNFLRAALDRGWKATGLDFDPQMLDHARRLGVTDLHDADLEAFHARSEKGVFDLVTLFDVLEHLPEPARALGLARDLLKPGGYLAVTLPNYLRPLPFGRDDFDYPPHHLTWWTPAALRSFVERQGFAAAALDHGHYMAWEYSRCVTYPVVGAAARAAKRLLLGARARGATYTELAERGAGPAALRDKAGRQRLVNAAVFGLHYLTLPVFGPLALWFRCTRPEGGMTIRLLARKT